MPKISVILPTYNRGNLLPRAIQSVLNQTYQDFELILVDDGSMDNTEEVVKSFGKEKGIVYLKHKKNRGAPAARNTGIKVAKGEYIAFQDSDDEWLPDKIEKQIKIFEHSEKIVGVVYSGFWKIKDDRKIYIPSKGIAKKEGSILKGLLWENFVGLPTAMVRVEVFNKMGTFDELLPQLQDWELWIRFSKHYLFKYINEALVISHHTPGGISVRDPHIIFRANKLILEKHFDEYKKYRQILANQYINVGHHLCLAGNLEGGRNYLKKAINAYPWNLVIFGMALSSFVGHNFYSKLTGIYRKLITTEYDVLF